MLGSIYPYGALDETQRLLAREFCIDCDGLPDGVSLWSVLCATEGQDEYIVIVNYATADQVMTDWLIHSTTADQWYRFEGYLLPGGGQVRVHSGPGVVDAPPDDLLGRQAESWPDSGGEAWLLDEDERVEDTWAY